jgi:cob(I)alamin adenosyltransferase
MANRLTKIYTKTGDGGKTGLGDGSRVDKFSPRIEGLGSIDELNSVIGIIISEQISATESGWLKKIQHDLFDIGGELSIPDLIKLTMIKVQFLESNIDKMNKELPPLKEFILPGGSKISAYTHLARTICRRVERNLFELNQRDKVNEVSLKYINRLSDFLFVLARHFNKSKNIEDILWKKNI